jgi:UDP-N-acetylmuramyl pentapeptide phosphotransferase/UDP-N-acetylglucosamine-1-phosphate transferase
MFASAIIPAHQAASTVAETVRAVRRIPAVAEVIVVDDGSRDGTADRARDSGADRVIVLPRNRGKGAALSAGLEAARHERVLFLDADLGESAVRAGELLQALPSEPAMAIAALPPQPGSGGFGLALGLTRAVIRLLTGLRPAAPMSGQRALPAVLVRHIGLAPRFAVEVGLTVEAAHLGVTPTEVSLPLEHRHTGRTVSGFLHRARQLKDVLLFLLFTGYGLGWPALAPARTAARTASWLCALALFIVLGSILAPPPGGWLAVVLAAVVLWLPALWVSAVWLGVRKPNYLGRRLPAAAGLLFPLIGLPALWFSGLEARVRLSGLLVVAVLGIVGLLDDVFAARRQARGLRGHLMALARGRLTTGAVKALGGLAAGFAAGCILHPGQPSAIVLDALLIALTANVLNLLDLRPGRCLKGFGLLSALAVVGGFLGVGEEGVEHVVRLLGPVAAAAIVSAPADFAGRTMMGDVGANVLGAAAGLALALSLGPWERLAAVVVLVAVHLVCERVSLSDLIARSRLLSFLDRLGADHLAPLPSDGVEPA